MLRAKTIAEDDRVGSGDRGLTLVELVATMAIAGILLALAVPGFSRLMERKRLEAATEVLVSDLRRARSESAKRNLDVGVAFSTADQCYGLQDDVALPCDCTAVDCTINGVVTTQSVGELTDVQLTQAAFGVAGAATTWDHLRGTANAGSVCLRTNGTGYRTRVIVSGLGRISVCSPSGAGNLATYPVCLAGLVPCP